MREVLFTRRIKLRADDALAHGLAEAARRDGMTLSEFARRELRSAVASRTRHGRPDDAGLFSATASALVLVVNSERPGRVCHPSASSGSGYCGGALPTVFRIFG